MGIRSRIKAKIQDRLQDIRALVRVVNEEANHPGRPQPHMVARNPLWGGEAGEIPAQKQVPSETEKHVSEPTSTISTASPPKEKKESKEAEDDDFWYLRGDDEGWSDLNPGKS